MTRILNSLKNCFNPKRGLTRIFQNADLRRILFAVRVEGESGWPYLVAGKRYLASGLFVPRVGNFVIFRNPKNQSDIFVKRVAAVIEDAYHMEGTVSWASSSKDFSVVPHRSVLGTMILNTSIQRCIEVFRSAYNEGAN